jgi:hypothetical protein
MLKPLKKKKHQGAATRTAPELHQSEPESTATEPEDDEDPDDDDPDDPDADDAAATEGFLADRD